MPRSAQAHPPPSRIEVSYNEHAAKVLLNEGAMPTMMNPNAYAALSPASASDEPVVTACILAFGGPDNNWDTLCICRPENRIPLREHAHFRNSLAPELKKLAIPVQLVDIPGKGRGLRATRDIATGDILIIERPLLICKHLLDLTTATNFDMAIDTGLTAQHKKEYFALYNCKSKAPGMIESLSIMRTNSIGVEWPFDKDETQNAVFNLISRANHSCIPNASLVWNPEYVVGLLRSERPIKKGEEITIQYTDLFDTSAARKADVLRKYSFNCTCPACTLSPALQKKSDKRRSALSERIPPKAIAWPTADPVASRRLQTGYDDAYIEETLHLCEEEGLMSQRAGLLAGYANYEAMRARMMGDPAYYTRAAEIAKRAIKEIIKMGHLDDWEMLDQIIKEKRRTEKEPSRPNLMHMLQYMNDLAERGGSPPSLEDMFKISQQFGTSGLSPARKPGRKGKKQ